ncbi:MAG: hypothetical protein WB711_11835 [Terriglobales bacterium]
MRFLRVAAVVAVCVLALNLFASASENKFGVADSSKITFDQPIRVGNTLLSSGDYQVLHTMDGDHHVMVFKKLNSKGTAEVRVQCHLVPLQEKAKRTETTYVLNAANQRVLHALTFKGDSAQHVF